MRSKTPGIRLGETFKCLGECGRTIKKRWKNHAYCRACRRKVDNERLKRWRHNNPQKVAAWRKRYYRTKRHELRRAEKIKKRADLIEAARLLAGGPEDEDAKDSE